MQYLEQIDDEPTTDQYYLMQIAREVAIKLMPAGATKSVKLTDFKLRREKPKVKTLAQYTKESKQFFNNLLGSNNNE